MTKLHPTTYEEIKGINEFRSNMNYHMNVDVACGLIVLISEN